MRVILSFALVTIAFVLAGCKRDKSTTAQPTPVSQVKTPSFVPPTAEQAYRLQDDCSRRGAAILKGNFVAPALSQDQVSRYNATTNRCYVRIEVHPIDLRAAADGDFSTFLYDGQTGEQFAFFELKGSGAGGFGGFACGNLSCVEEKVAACMGGKECEPE